MAEYLKAADLPFFSDLNEGMDFAAFLRRKRPCKCLCVPSANVVYQSRSASASKQGYFFDGAYYKKKKTNYDFDGSSASVPINTQTIRITDEVIDERTGKVAQTEVTGTENYNAVSVSTENCVDDEGQSGTITTTSTRTRTSTYTMNPNISHDARAASGSKILRSFSGADAFSFNNECTGESDSGSSPFSGTSLISVSGSPPFGSTTYETEINISDVESRVDEDLAASSYLAIQIAHSVSRKYEAKKYRFDYIDRPGLDAAILDTAAFDAAVAARVATADNELTSAQASLTATQTEHTDKQQELSDKESDLTDAEADLETLRTSSQAARQAVADKDAEIIAIKHKLLYDTLTDAETTALENDRDSKQAERNDLYDAYRDLEFGYFDGEAIPGVQDLQASTIPDLKRDIILLECEVAELADEVTLRQANVTQLTARKAAAVANENALWLEYSLGASETAAHSLNDTETTISKSEFRYRITVPLDGNYDTTGGVSFKVTWRERTWKHEDRGEGQKAGETYTWVEKTATVSANEGDYEATSGWMTVAVPVVHHSIQVVGIAATSTLSISTEYQGGSAAKAGVFGYTANAPFKVFRRETISGGFAGCPESNLDPKDYSGVREWEEGDSYPTETTPFSDDLNDALDDANWPSGLYLQPSTSSKTTGKKPAFPTSEDETTREFVRTVKCGENDLEENLKFELSDEYTTAAMQAEVDDLLDDTWPNANGLYNPSSTAPFQNPIALNFLYPNELEYRRQRFRYKFSGSLPTATLEARNETFTAKKKTMNLLTGVISESTINVTLSYDEDDSFQQEDDWTILDAGEDELVWLDDFEGVERDEYEGDILVEPLEETPNYAP